MGYDTTYLGHLTITPRLNHAEVEWLSGFADWGALGGGDPHHLPMNPRASLREEFAENRGVLAASHTVPSGVGDWLVSIHGDRISWRRREKSNDATQSLRFLVEHFLGPDASAKDSANPDFAAFTFDHRLDGIIAGCRDDTDELFLLRVIDSEVEMEILVPGTSYW